MNFCVGDIKHKNNPKQAWSQVHASNTMGAILCLVPVPTAQILHPDSDIKYPCPISLSTFHGSLWGKKHGDPRFFFQVFPKNSLIKNIFEEEKSLIAEHDFFGGEIFPYLVYFGQGKDFKLTTELSEKV